MKARLLAAVVMLPVLVGCVARLAPPQPDEEQAEGVREVYTTAAVNDFIGMVERVLRVSGRLRTAGAPLCGDRVAPLLGIDVERGVAMSQLPHFWKVYLETFAVGKAVTVTVVDSASPAARAGVHSGDRIVAVHGRRARKAPDVFEILRDEPDRPPDLRLERGGETLEVEIERVPACAHEVWVDWTSEIITSRKEHDHAAVTVGMIRFVENDDELAVVIGHELAHRILGGRHPSYPKKEVRADEIGLYLVARAGFDETVAPAFWERFAIEKPWMIRWEPDSKRVKEPRHARVAERLLAMRTVLERIAQLRADGRPLLPPVGHGRDALGLIRSANAPPLRLRGFRGRTWPGRSGAVRGMPPVSGRAARSGSPSFPRAAGR